MSLHVIVAHTGERLDADPVSITSLDNLRTWASHVTSIPPQDQILLTGKGKHVKLQALLTEKEIFLFDRVLFSQTNDPSAPLVAPTPPPDPFSPGKPPDKLASDTDSKAETDLKAWQNLFAARRDWAMDIVARVQPLVQIASQSFYEQDNIERALRVATGNHDNHIRALGQKHSDLKGWIDEVTKEQADLRATWHQDLDRLASIPAKAELAPFLSMKEPQSGRKSTSRRGSAVSTGLDTFVDQDIVRDATSTSKNTCKDFSNRVVELGGLIGDLGRDYDNLLSAVEQSQSRSDRQDSEEPSRLYHEIEMVAQKIDSDCDHVTNFLTTQPKPAAQASKMALLHTRNFLPALVDLTNEMNELAKRAVEQKNSAVSIAIDNMQTIAAIEVQLNDLNAELANLNISDEAHEAFATLAFVSRLPLAYGSLLIEAVRRREWTDKIKRDSSTLQEEIANYRDEEERRRKKWFKQMQGMINLDNFGSSVGVEINIYGEEQAWPQIDREELEGYLATLRSIGGLEDAIKTVEQGIKELNKPTKQQVKHAKAFKMGSVHEAAFGKQSLMMHGEDEVSVLKASYGKLEDELKSSRSRVRKLEDLLHRSTTINRPSTAGFNADGPPEFGNVPPSPRLQDMSRRSSVSSRRVSSTQTAEDKNLIRRVLALEEELAGERGLRATLEKQAATRNAVQGEAQRQIEEANSTKKDLLENMEAQQREFSVERRALEDELASYKVKVEEVEDELDRILGSRDNERTGTDNRIHDLITELDQIRKESGEDVQAAQKRVKEIESAMKRQNLVEEERLELLMAVHSQLSPDGETPDEPTAIFNGLETLARRSRDHNRNLANAIAMAKSDNEALRQALDSQRGEITSLTEKLEQNETASAKLRDDFGVEQAKSASLASELEDERTHLKDLRSKFAEGETGSESLRQRVTEEEAKVAKLSTELGSTKSHVNALDVELSSLQKKHRNLQSGLSTDNTRLKKQSERAKDLSKRIFTQNDRLLRLLEALGFAISQNENGNMLVQRASKSGGSTVLSETVPSTTGSVGPLSLRRMTDEEPDLSILLWPEKESEEDEASTYTDFISVVDRFDLTAFSDAISKRMRDIEHTARKWQKEARAHRERSHRSQAEAHDKIAFRSFREGDLALFLPTRNQATRPWAAFNVGAPHYFLRETDAHKLQNKEWLVARINKVEERVVDLSKTLEGSKAGDRRSLLSTVSNAATASSVADDDDNPFELSDGLRWYLVDASEEKPGAPFTPALGKSTVASAHVDAKGTVRMKKSSKEDASGRLNKSLDSRRSSTNSKKSGAAPGAAGADTPDRGSIGSGSRAPGTSVAAAGTIAQPGPSTQQPAQAGAGPSSAQAALEQAREEEEDRATRGDSSFARRNTSPPKKLAATGSSSVSPSKSARSMTASTSKRSGGTGERERSPRKRGGAWDSLWQLDFSVESGSPTKKK